MASLKIDVTVIEKMISERSKLLRQAKEIADKLAVMGVSLHDEDEGTRYWYGRTVRY